MFRTHIRIALACMLVCGGVVRADSAPVVSDVTASQRTDGSGIVDIWYTLKDDDNDQCTITVQVSEDTGDTWTIVPSGGALSGDLVSVAPGRRRIQWGSRADLPWVYGTNYRVRVTADDGHSAGPPDMVLVPGGTFRMGDIFGEGYAHEQPVHVVTLSSFFMSRHEVTNGEYCQFLNAALQRGRVVVRDGLVCKPGYESQYAYCETSARSANSQIAYEGWVFSVRTKGGRDMSKDPMIRVTWYGAAVFCNWRSEQEGRQPCYDPYSWECDFNTDGYRLPTEAQWEYAARGGLSGHRFPWGDTITHSQANYYSRSDYPYDVSPTRGFHPGWDDGIRPLTSPVGSFPPDGCGLYDMAGNVWEWCNDWYRNDYYDRSPDNDPTGPWEGSDRVLRGGGWYTAPSTCRVASRYYGEPLSRGDWVGFRLVVDLE